MPSTTNPQDFAASAEFCLRSQTDIRTALECAMSQGGLLLSETQLAPEFFNLASGLAGELFQKFVNYGLRLALVIADPAAHGPRLRELAFEHRNHPHIRFFDDTETAGAWLRAAH